MTAKQKEKVCRRLANQLILENDILIPRLTSFDAIDSSFFYLLFEKMMRVKLKRDATASEPKRLRFLIKRLEDILGTDMIHLKPEEMASRNPQQIHYMLEILKAMCTYLSSGEQPKTTTKASQTDPRPQVVSDISPGARFPSGSSSTSSVPLYPNDSPISSSSFSLCNCPDILQTTPEPCDCQPKVAEVPQTAQEKVERDKISGQNKPSGPLRPPSEAKREPLAHRMAPVTRSRQVASTRTLINQLKEAKGETLALQLGHRLEEVLKLEEATKEIERKINVFNEPARRQVKPRYNQSKNVRGNRTPLRGRVRPKRPINTGVRQGAKKVDANFQRDPSLEALLSKFTGIPRETVKQLENLEVRHKKMVQNIENEVKNKESKGRRLLAGAVEQEMKRSDIIRHEIERLHKLEMLKKEAINKVNEKALNREERTERAKIYRMIEEYHQKVVSRYKSAQSREEHLLREKFSQQWKERRDQVLEMKRNLREQEEEEYRKQKLLLEAFDNVYQQKYQMVREKLAEEEAGLKERMSHNTQVLNKIRRQFTSIV